MRTNRAASGQRPRRILAFQSKQLLKALASLVSRRLRPAQRHAIMVAASAEIRGRELAEQDVPTIHASLINTRTSDTLFVLGRAPNIDELQSDHWIEISRHDSIGFNSWTSHAFVPTHYLAQAPLTEGTISRLCSEQYAESTIMLRGTLLARQGIEAPGLRSLLEKYPVHNGRLQYLPELPLDGDADASAEDILMYLRQLGLWTFGAIPPVIPKFRATVGLAVSLGYCMGYRRIVVCGSDSRTLGYARGSRADGGQGDWLSSRVAYLRTDLWTHESRIHSVTKVSDFLRAIDRDLRANFSGAVYWGAPSGPKYGLASFWSASRVR